MADFGKLKEKSAACMWMKRGVVFKRGLAGLLWIEKALMERQPAGESRDEEDYEVEEEFITGIKM